MSAQTARPDPLLNVVQAHPEEAVWFVKAVTLFGGISGVVVSVPCAIFLSMHWTTCGSCNRPLRYWILVQCLLQLFQSPLRMAFYIKIRKAQQDNVDIIAWFTALTQSLAWRVSKIVSVGTYAWFILGVVWLLNSTECRSCPGLYKLSLAVCFTAVARLIVTLIVFYHSFQPATIGEAPPKPRGASQDVIDSIPLERFSDSMSETSCAVCLSEFERCHMLRRLPCNHSFHSGCVDNWLQHNKVCPLCVQDVEVLTQQCAEKNKPESSGSTSCCQRVRASFSQATVWRAAGELRSRSSLF